MTILHIARFWCQAVFPSQRCFDWWLILLCSYVDICEGYFCLGTTATSKPLCIYHKLRDLCLTLQRERNLVKQVSAYIGKVYSLQLLRSIWAKRHNLPASLRAIPYGYQGKSPWHQRCCRKAGSFGCWYHFGEGVLVSELSTHPHSILRKPCRVC